MDDYIHNYLQASIDGLYCKAYIASVNNKIAAFFALNFASLDLDPQNIQNAVYTNDQTIDLPEEYIDMFSQKSSFPAVEISYLAVRDDFRGLGIGTTILDVVKEKALEQDFAGCQFVTVVPLDEPYYSATGFYEKSGFFHKQTYGTRIDKTMYAPLRIWAEKPL